MLPKPVTSYSGGYSFRIINESLYKERVMQDPYMNDVSALIEQGNRVFDDTSNLFDLTDLNQLQQKKSLLFYLATFKL